MPYLINGQPIPEELIREESERLARDVHFQNIAPMKPSGPSNCMPPPKPPPPIKC